MVTGGTGDDDNISQASTSSTSSSLSRESLSEYRKQAKHVTKAQENVQILRNSEIFEVRSVANELSKILEKGGDNAKKLENIINKSNKEDLHKGCLELYEDIADYLQPLANFDDSKQAQLETKILEKLPERIEEAEYKRSLSPKKVRNILKGLGEESTLSGKSSYLKAEYGKLDVAGKSLAVAAVATIGALASPFVLGAGLVAAPFVGTGIAC